MNYKKEEFVNFLAGNPPWVDKTSLWWREQPLVRHMAEDIVELHTQIEKHTCKSHFIPGVVVGVAICVASGYLLEKRDPRKKNTP